MGHDLVTSRYTFRLLLSQGYALFNASIGSVLRLQGADAAELSELLSGPRILIPHDTLGADLTARLRRNGFLVDSDFDELAVVRERAAGFDELPPPGFVYTEAGQFRDGAPD